MFADKNSSPYYTLSMTDVRVTSCNYGGSPGESVLYFDSQLSSQSLSYDYSAPKQSDSDKTVESGWTNASLVKK